MNVNSCTGTSCPTMLKKILTSNSFVSGRGSTSTSTFSILGSKFSSVISIWFWITDAVPKSTNSNRLSRTSDPKTERFFNSVLGSEVRDSLFDFVDFGTASVIQNQILITLENFEPRIDNVEVEVEPRPDLNEFEVTVFYNIVGQDIPTQEFTFMLEATR